MSTNAAGGEQDLVRMHFSGESFGTPAALPQEQQLERSFADASQELDSDGFPTRGRRGCKTRLVGAIR